MLDRLPPQLRHLLLMLLAALLTWASTDLVPWLSSHDGWGPIAGTVAAGILAWVLPLTRQYGVGAPDAADDDGDHEL